MLVIGAGGLAAQLFDEFVRNKTEPVVFWSESETRYPFIRDNFDIIKSDEEITHHFHTISRSFILGVGNIKNRKWLAKKFEQLGGEIISFTSPRSYIGSYTMLGKGSVILARTEIESGVTIGERCLINKRATIGHGCVVGSDCEICAAAILAGEVRLGEDTFVGTGAIILPKVQIGKNVKIAAGAIVKKNVPDNAVVAGEFATIKFYQKVKDDL